jgi:phage baseplate assembly protein W
MSTTTNILSDLSVEGDVRKASRSSRLKQWTDLDLNLTLHPIRKDIVPLRDDQAIKYAVRNLLLTNFYEKPFNLGVGANLRALLFEPADAITKQTLRKNILRSIKAGEQRVDVIFVNIVDDPDSNSYRILVKFRIKEYDTQEDVEIVLRRLR